MCDQVRKTCETGKALLLAKSAFNIEYIRFWNQVPECDDETGFRLLELFRKEVDQYVFKYKRGATVGLENAANEMFRLVAVGSADYTTDELRGFCKWYDKTSNRIGRAIGDLFDYHGDGFGDLCDSLPLAGEAIVKRCLATGKKPKRDGFLEESEVHEAIKELGEGWAELIGGENYVDSVLAREAKKWFLHDLMRSEEWFPDAESQQAVSYADHGER